MSRFSIRHTTGAQAASDIAPLDTATFTAICLASCKRLPAMRRSADARRLDRLVEAGAWTDAALALIAIELPAWQLRRLAFDEGEWHCALSTQRDMPDWLDDAVETHHPDMATAILDAFRIVISRKGTSRLAQVPVRRATERSDFAPISCEDYC